MTTANFLRGRRRVLLLAPLGLLTFACGTGAPTTPAASPRGIVVITDTRAAGEAALGGVPLRAVSRDDLLAERRIVPTSVEPDPDDPSTIVVRFDGGIRPCHGVRLAVDEGPASVTVLLFGGTPPEGVGTVCPDLVVPQELRWKLRQPLGTRELIWDMT
ncbi:MAG TPA: hypothetical protein VF183_10605 [Acidimicrobiales bacterium]